MTFLVRLIGKPEDKVLVLEEAYGDFISLDVAIAEAKAMVARRNRKRLAKATHFEVSKVVFRGERKRKEYRKVVR